MEWTEQFLPWRLDQLSDDNYTALIDELINLDLKDPMNLRKSVVARYFLHFAVLSNSQSDPECKSIALEAIVRVNRAVPWYTDQMSNKELLEADQVLGEIYC